MTAPTEVSVEGRLVGYSGSASLVVGLTSMLLDEDEEYSGMPAVSLGDSSVLLLPGTVTVDLIVEVMVEIVE